jgi:23S rRNA pseudouridine1911/1915/1917 synthase
VFVAARLPELTRAQVKRLVDEGDVLVDGKPAAKAGVKLRAGDHVVVRIRPPAPLVAQPEAMPLVVLYEDDDLIVVDKPAGLVVHPAPGHAGGTLVNGLLAHCEDEDAPGGTTLSGIGGELRPGIVHRIDKDTTGVLVVAKSEVAHRVLSEAFQTKDLLREYVAVVSPAPPTPGATIRTLYNRHPIDRKKFSSKVARGKPAATRYEVVERFTTPGGATAAVIHCRLETGRTHQIRVHMADSGWPLLGDQTYGKYPKDPLLGEVARELGRQALHAARLEIAHPVTGAPLVFRTDPPADLQRLLARLRAGA